MSAGPRAVERTHSGLRLQLLYPLGSKVPGLRRLPQSLRRVTRRRLTELAVAAHLARCRRVEMAAITGSRGKTTTKDLLAQMLAAAAPTSKTPKNDNGLYGVPATLLAIDRNDRYAVIEAGIFDSPGEMDWMASLFEPRVAVLTGIGEEHSSAYGSLEAAVAEKRRLLERVGTGGRVVVSADDPLALETCAGLEAPLLTAGWAEGADFRLLAAEPDWPRGVRVRVQTPSGEVSGLVGLFGSHLAPSVAVSLAAAWALEVPPAKALAAVADFEPPDGRLRPAPAPGGATWLLDDSKSRLPSQSAAIRALGDVRAEGRRIAVLGEIQEGELEWGWANAAELLPGRAEMVIAVGAGADRLAAALAEGELEVSDHLRLEPAAKLLRELVAEGDVVLLHGATYQHLRRLRVLAEEEGLGCRVRLCSLHWLCDDCPHLHGEPPASVVVER